MTTTPRLTLAALSLLLPLAACSTTAPETTERDGLITIKGEPATLVGHPVNVGDRAPDFAAIANDGSTQKLSEYHGVTVILSCVPSLKTPVCDRETRTFNEKAVALTDNCVVLTVSTDSPEVQKEWCGAAGITRVITLSDEKLGECGRRFGVAMKGKGRLSRAVFVIDPKGVVKYEEIVKEVATEPNYTAALDAANAASGGR